MLELINANSLHNKCILKQLCSFNYAKIVRLVTSATYKRLYASSLHHQ